MNTATSLPELALNEITAELTCCAVHELSALYAVHMLYSMYSRFAP